MARDRHEFDMLDYIMLSILATRSSGDLILSYTGGGVIINLVVLSIGALIVIDAILYRPIFVLAFLPFLFFLILGLAKTPESDSVKLFSNLMTYFVMFLYGCRNGSSYSICAKSISVLVYSLAVPLLYSFIDVLRPSYHGGDGFRLQSTFTHPNIFAMYLVAMFSIVLFHVSCGFRLVSNLAQRESIILCLLCVACLIGTQTRSAWICAAVVVLVFAAIFSLKSLVSLIVIGLALLFTPQVQNRLSDLSSGNTYVDWRTPLNSYAWRKLLWDYALKDLGWNNFFGKGLNSFYYNSPKFFPLGGRSMYYAHSVYVQMIYEIGLFGLLSFISFFGFVFFIAMSSSGQYKAKLTLFCVMLAYLGVSYSDNVLYYLAANWYYWMAIGLLVSGIRSKIFNRFDVPESPIYLSDIRAPVGEGDKSVA